MYFYVDQQLTIHAVTRDLELHLMKVSVSFILSLRQFSAWNSFLFVLCFLLNHTQLGRKVNGKCTYDKPNESRKSNILCLCFTICRL